MDFYGNMLAAGFTEDETIFINSLNEDSSDTFQNKVPILAFYPVDDFTEAKVF